jgi:hypothetical protein
MTKDAVRLGYRDPPPALAPDEIPTPEDLAKIARQLLREQAKDDAELAAKLRRRGIALSPAQDAIQEDLP